jgi:hypothetical protein
MEIHVCDTATLLNVFIGQHVMVDAPRQQELSIIASLVVGENGAVLIITTKQPIAKVIGTSVAFERL